MATTVTIEVPDWVAEQLRAWRDGTDPPASTLHWCAASIEAALEDQDDAS